jgi:hypothetical protein
LTWPPILATFLIEKSQLNHHVSCPRDTAVVAPVLDLETCPEGCGGS